MYRLSSLLVLALPTLLVTMTARPALADDRWLLASQKDKQVRKYLELTLEDAVELFDAHDADAVLVLDQVLIDSSKREHKLTENRIWWIREGDFPDLVNWVRDYPREQEVQDVAAFVIRAGAIDADAAMEASITRLEDNRINLQESDDDQRLSNLVVAFPTAEPGMLLGISVRTRVKEPLYWYTHVVKKGWPVARSEVRMKNSRHLSYLSAGQRFPKGSLKRQILDKKKDQVRDVVMYTHGVAPIERPAFAPPAALQSPRIVIALRSQHLDFGNGNELWWHWRDWNQVSQLMDQFQGLRLEERTAASAEAQRIQASTAEGEDVRDALYRFVRDDLLPVDSFFFTTEEDLATVDRILEGGTGSVADRSYLLLAMLHALDIPATLAWAHDPDEGDLLMKYPNWLQVRHPLVIAGVGDDQEWYDISCRPCAPGELRPRLRETRALIYDQNIGALHQDLMEAAMKKAFMQTLDPVDTYFRALNAVKWTRWIDTPGDLTRTVGTVAEEFVVPGDGSPAEYTLRALGTNPCSQKWTASEDEETFLNEWLGRRFDSIGAGVLLGSARGDSLRAKLEVDPPPLPPVTGDTWVLPPEVVYGEPWIEPWSDDRPVGFYIRETQELHYRFRTPLPAGWKGAKLPRSVMIGARDRDPLYYRAYFRVEGTDLVVERMVRQRAWYTDDENDLRILGDRAAEIAAVESTPIVVERWDDAPTTTGGR